MFYLEKTVFSVPVFDFLPDSICSVQLEAASVKNRPGTYSLQSRLENHFWDASEARGIMSIVKNGHDQIWRPCRSRNVAQMYSV